jgi:hypothetical protein
MGVVAKMFNCLVERRLGDLVVLWEKDMTEARRREGRHRRRKDTIDEEEDRVRRKVLELLGQGNVW